MNRFRACSRGLRQPSWCYSSANAPLSRAFHQRNMQQREPYWQKIPRWRDVPEEDFLSYKWQECSYTQHPGDTRNSRLTSQVQMKNTVQTVAQLSAFLREILPPQFAGPRSATGHIVGTGDAWTPEKLIDDVSAGIKRAPMAIRLTPHILSCMDWSSPSEDPVRRQFIALASTAEEDHPQLKFDSLHETEDSPVKGIVHRYPDKLLSLATSVCPVYCRFCNRSYAVGAETEAASKTRFLPITAKWKPMFEYVARTPQVHDVVVSGGDALTLEPGQMRTIGEQLLAIPHVKRMRFASKGLGVCPSRIVDENDTWADTLSDLSAMARRAGKAIALHTHINHMQEISWVTAQAADRLYQAGVTVRNQTVLLNGVNNSLSAMSELIHGLAGLNIQPYYVYQGDMVRGLEDLRTPLDQILQLEQHIRGIIAGFLTPSFVVDLPGGGGKRLACSYDKYDRATGVSTFHAPGVSKDNAAYQYHDPMWAVTQRSASTTAV